MGSVGLPVLCNDQDSYAPVIRVWSLFAAAARQAGPDTGWLVGDRVGDQGLNQDLLARLKAAPTLYSALNTLVLMGGMEASGNRLGLCERRDDVLIYTHYPGMAGTPGYDQSQSYQIGVFIGLIRHFLGKHWVPNEVGIESWGRRASATAYFPGARFMMGQAAAYVAVPRSSLSASSPSNRSAEECVDGMAPTTSFDFVGTLRQLLKSYIVDGYVSAKTAANLMECSERTLARRLAAAGFTYGKLLDDVRFSVAKNLLKEPQAKIVDVASAVGFVDQGNFTRMFRRIGGLGPKEFRKRSIL